MGTGGDGDLDVECEVIGGKKRQYLNYLWEGVDNE